MRSTKKSVVAFGSAAALVLTLTAACSSDDPAPQTTGSETTASGVTIDEAHSVGAMADFAAGTPFVATEPVTFSLLYRDHPNYPLKKDWLIFSELKANTKVTFDITDHPWRGSAPLDGK